MHIMDFKVIKKIGLAVFNEGKVLMARSKKNAEVFYFAGGKPELGESDFECLQREAKEELGVNIKPNSIQFLAEFEDVAHGKEADVMLNIKLYTGELIGMPTASSEVAEINYFDSSINPKHMDVITAKQIFPWLEQNKYIK